MGQSIHGINISPMTVGAKIVKFCPSENFWLYSIHVSVVYVRGIGPIASKYCFEKNAFKVS